LEKEREIVRREARKKEQERLQRIEALLEDHVKLMKDENKKKDDMHQYWKDRMKEEIKNRDDMNEYWKEQMKLREDETIRGMRR